MLCMATHMNQLDETETKGNHYTPTAMQRLDASTAIDVCMHMDGAWRSGEQQMANVTAFLP